MFRSAPFTTGLIALLLSGAVMTGWSAAAQQTTDEANARLKEIEDGIRSSEEAQKAMEAAAREAESEAEKLSRQLVATGRRVQAAEVDATRIETQIKVLEELSRKKGAELDARRGELKDLVAALTVLAKRPAAATLLRPGEAIATARSASVMGNLVPRIEKMAAALASDLEAMTSIRTDLARERSALNQTLARLNNSRRELERLIGLRRSEAERARETIRLEGSRMAQLAEEALNIRALIESLAKAAEERAKAARNAGRPARTDPPPGFSEGAFKQARGRIPLPVSGDIIRNFGDRDGFVTQPGLTIQARSGAQVTAPHDGQVVFAGPYQGYGLLMIISHGNGYHSLLAGLDALYGGIGQWVLSGEPVGRLTARGPEAGQLYMEFRANGEAFDPASWLRRGP